MKSSILLAVAMMTTTMTMMAGLAVVDSFSPPMTALHRHHGSTTVPAPSIRPPRADYYYRSNNLAPSTTTTLGTLSTTTRLSAALLDEETTQKLVLLTFEKAIEAGVPSLFLIVTTWWILSMVRSGGRNESRGGSGMGRMMRGGNRNSGKRSSRGGRGNGRHRGGIDDPYYSNNSQQRSLGPVEELYDDIYDDLSGSGDANIPPFFKLLGGGGRRGGRDGGFNNNNGAISKLNIGIPKQTYLTVTKINSRIDSYRYSMIEATRGKAIAASELRNKGFMDTFVRALGITSSGSSSSSGIATSLTQAEGTALITLERDFLLKGSELVNEASSLMRAITNAAIVLEMEDMGIEPGLLDVLYVDAEIIMDDVKDKLTLAQKDFFGIAKTNIDTTELTTTKKDDKSHSSNSNKKATTAVTVGERIKIEKQSDIMRTIKEVETINTEIMMLELDFIRSIVDILGPNRADMIRTAIVGNVIGAEVGMLLRTLKERPLSTILSSFLLHDGDGDTTNHHRKNLYVTRFPGDVTASQLNELREEVTGILRSAQPGDEALLILQSGGGTVTGYGLAAAQLLRFKAKDIKLTVCVEQVAASGGYMMCCTADRIVASPFAVLGSIGVISEIPNAYERLQREGIEFQTITAGKFKRTVTPTKKITKEDIKKSEADIAEIFNLFKGFVKRQRPQLDIDNVATGETWFGEDALAKGLCDEIGTADDVLLDFIDNDYDVYEVVYKPPPVSGVGLLAGLPGGRSDTSNTSDNISIGGLLGWRSALRSVVRGIVSDVKDQIVTELSSSMNDMNSIERRFMAQDNTADEIEMKD